MLILGFLLSVVPIPVIYFWVRPRVVTEESFRTTEALIIDKRTEKAKGGSGGPTDLFGFLFFILFYFFALAKGYDKEYIITIKFETNEPVSEQVTLEIAVAKNTYEKLIPGTTVNVKYSAANPRIAIICRRMM